MSMSFRSRFLQRWIASAVPSLLWRPAHPNVPEGFTGAASVSSPLMTNQLSEGSAKALLQIGEVAEQVGLSLRTVRYYEEVGLVSPSARSEGGFRLYSEADVSKLALVKRMKPLGLTLEEMGELVTLIEDGSRGDALEDADLRRVVEGLREYATRGDSAIERFDRDLTQARQLRVRIGEQLGRCELLLEQRGNA